MSVIYHPNFCQSNQYDTASDVTLKLSVVIIAQGRTRELRLCLEALRAQTWQPREIIVVDMTEDDDSIPRLCADAFATYVKHSQGSIDRARNIGAAMANADLVAFLGEDSIPRIDWSYQLVEAFEDKEVDIVTGCVRPGSLESFAQIMYAKHWSVRGGFHKRDFNRSDFLGSSHSVFPVWELNCGANLAVRRSSFARYGLFDPALGHDVPGDIGESEFIYRVLGQGGVCRYTPEIVVWRRYIEDIEVLQPMLRNTVKGQVAALRIQAQRFPGRGNWRYILVSMPIRFARRAVERVRWGRDQRNWFLMSEIKGYFDGLFCSIGPKRKQLH